jgi:hypothetical protein
MTDLQEHPERSLATPTGDLPPLSDGEAQLLGHAGKRRAFIGCLIAVAAAIGIVGALRLGTHGSASSQQVEAAKAPSSAPVVPLPAAPTTPLPSLDQPGYPAALPAGVTMDGYTSFEANAATYLASRFGGTWLDTSQPTTRLVVTAVGMNDTDIAHLNRLVRIPTNAKYVVYRSVKYSQSTLAGYAQALRTLQPADRPGGASIDAKLNKVRLRTSASPNNPTTAAEYQTLTRAARALVPADALEIDVVAGIASRTAHPAK